MTALRTRTFLRSSGQVTNVELFFDLVYVFAVTQLSHRLVEHQTVDGAIQTAVLFAMVWQVWVYTTWTVNYLDPARDSVRVVLLLVMLASLVVAAGIPEAFHDRGMVVAVAYVTTQLGRTVFAIWATRGEQVQVVFLRILPWLVVSSAAVLAGATQHEHHLREVLWAAAVVIDLVGAVLGFFVPGLGRPQTSDWTIDGGHFAERCQAFVLIALGESVVVIGGLVDLDDPGWRDLGAFVAAFLGVVLLWWIYFDRVAADSAHEIEQSADPGRLARSAFHWIHPLIIGGIILTAAADEETLREPGAYVHAPTAWFMLGGTALFVGGHALFKLVVWRTVSWPRVIAVVVLAGMGALAPHVSTLVLGCCTLAVVVAVAVADRVLYPALEPEGSLEPV